MRVMDDNEQKHSQDDVSAEMVEHKSDRTATEDSDDAKASPVREIGGRKGLDPVRYGDWEKNGRCIDF